MSLKNVARFAAATRGLKNTAKNLSSIRAAKAKKKEDDVLNDLKKKKAKLEIEELETKGERSALESKIFNKITDEMFKEQDSVSKGKEATIDMAEQKERDKAKSFGEIAKAAIKDPDVDFLLTGITPGLPDEPESSVAENVNTRIQPKNSFLGGLEDSGLELTGDTRTGFGIRPSQTRDIIKVDEKTGKATKTDEVSKGSFIFKGNDGADFELPASITTRSEAIEYLTKVKGFTPEQADLEVEKFL